MRDYYDIYVSSKPFQVSTLPRKELRLVNGHLTKVTHTRLPPHDLQHHIDSLPRVIKSHSFDGIHITIGRETPEQRIDIPREVVTWLGKDKKVAIRAKDGNFALDHQSEICGIRMKQWMVEREKTKFSTFRLEFEDIRFTPDTQPLKGHARRRDQQKVHHCQTAQQPRDKKSHQKQNHHEGQDSPPKQQPSQDEKRHEDGQRDGSQDNPQHQPAQWDGAVHFTEDEIILATIEMTDNPAAFFSHAHEALKTAVLEYIAQAAPSLDRSASAPSGPANVQPDAFPPRVSDIYNTGRDAESPHASDATFSSVLADPSDVDLAAMPGAFPVSFSEYDTSFDSSSVPGAYPASVSEDDVLVSGSDPGPGTCCCL